jgi:hypothetical protein
MFHSLVAFVSYKVYEIVALQANNTKMRQLCFFFEFFVSCECILDSFCLVNFGLSDIAKSSKPG